MEGPLGNAAVGAPLLARELVVTAAGNLFGTCLSPK
jgi:hypothetical protein